MLIACGEAAAMIRLLALITAFASATPGFAQEAVGCDKFKWRLDDEKALLATATPVASGGQAAQASGAALKLSLLPLAEARLPSEPSRKPKSPESYAGFVHLPTPPLAGVYRVTLSDPGWIDILQEGRLVPSGEFTGALGCEGLRKSVKFNLSVAPLTIEITDAGAREIRFVLTPE
jgi:hypothetical protein